MSNIKKDVAAYWREITGPQGVYSTSHYTYRNLVLTYGSDAVEKALDPYIQAERKALRSKP